MPLCFPTVPKYVLRGPSILLVFLTGTSPILTTGTQLMSVELNWNALNDSTIPFPNCNWHFGAYHTVTRFKLFFPGILLLASLTLTHWQAAFSLPSAASLVKQREGFYSQHFDHQGPSHSHSSPSPNSKFLRHLQNCFY